MISFHTYTFALSRAVAQAYKMSAIISFNDLVDRG